MYRKRVNNDRLRQIKLGLREFCQDNLNRDENERLAITSNLIKHEAMQIKEELLSRHHACQSTELLPEKRYLSLPTLPRCVGSTFLESRLRRTGEKHYKNENKNSDFSDDDDVNICTRSGGDNVNRNNGDNDICGNVDGATSTQHTDGTLTNVVDFEKGKLKGFRVVVEGEPISETTMRLSFKKLKLLRKSRFPRLFGEITIRLPSRLIRWLGSSSKNGEKEVVDGISNIGPYLQLRYLDDNLRMHTTNTGNWFIQTRL